MGAPKDQVPQLEKTNTALRYIGFQGQNPVPWTESPGHVSPEQGLLCSCGWSLRIHGWPSRDSAGARADHTLPATPPTWAAAGPLGPADRKEGPPVGVGQSPGPELPSVGTGLGSPTLKASVPRVVLPELGPGEQAQVHTVFNHVSPSSRIVL